MKNILKSLTVGLLAVAVVSSAFADGRRGYYPHGQHRGYDNRHNSSDWVAPLLFLGLAGAVIGAAASQQTAPPPQPMYVSPPVVYEQTAPVYVAPPAPIAQPQPDPANAWYFCRSVGQYYPYVQNCPEGWQLVSPTPQQ